MVSVGAVNFVGMVTLEYMAWWQAALIWLPLAAFVVGLGMWSMAGLTPARKWVSIGLRLTLLAILVMVFAGVRWERRHTDLQVLVVRDISASVLRYAAQTSGASPATIDERILEFTRRASEDKYKVRSSDRIGMIDFADTAYIRSMPNTVLENNPQPLRRSASGTDIASAIQLSLATFSKDAMKRLVLVCDGNMTSGNIDSAINAAVAQGVPIDVILLSYRATNEILVENIVAPSWKREQEKFTLNVRINSTNARPVKGKLRVAHNGEPTDMDPYTPGIQTEREVVLVPGRNVQNVDIPPQSPGAHRFTATFQGEGQEKVQLETAQAGVAPNNVAQAIVFVRGRGSVLYLDNATDVAGREIRKQFLARQLARQGVDLVGTDIAGFPRDLAGLQAYDAIVLNNVPLGNAGSVGTWGLSEDQAVMLTRFVHDMGGGLVVIGGENTFGAGGWLGSRLEEILPVDMEVPSRRAIPKGALALVIHSAEAPEGNYWAEQCALAAVDALSSRDDVSVTTFSFGNGKVVEDYPMIPKGDGTRVKAAIKAMKLGDMPDFDDAFRVALYGANNTGGITRSSARQKHVIVLSDGDPQKPRKAYLDDMKRLGISCSTVTIYPHVGGAPQVMVELAKELGGQTYGPLQGNLNVIPQIFIKEAQIVKRSLIQEDSNGFGVVKATPGHNLVANIGEVPPFYGYVLVSRKASPLVEVPLTISGNQDPLLATWQTGLGRVTVFTSDAHNKWAAPWIPSPNFGTFWGQVLSGVLRPPTPQDVDITTRVEGDKGKVRVEVVGADGRGVNFQSFGGVVTGPDLSSKDIRLTQTEPGVYEAEFDARESGQYIVALARSGPGSGGGPVVSGVVVESSPEMRQLTSNDDLMRDIARRTGGRVLQLDPTVAGLFSRDGVTRTASPLPVWDILLPIALALLLLDVASRRIAWDAAAMRRYVTSAAKWAGSFLTVRKVEGQRTMDALKRTRDDVAERGRTQAAPPVAPPPPQNAATRAQAKFDAPASASGDVQDITQALGGATDKPLPPKKSDAPRSIGADEPTTNALLEAKRRAQQRMKDQDEKDKR